MSIDIGPFSQRNRGLTRRDALLMGGCLAFAPAGSAFSAEGMESFRDNVLQILQRHFPQQHFVKGGTASEIESEKHHLYLFNIYQYTGKMSMPEREAAVVEWFAYLDQKEKEYEAFLADFQRIRPFLRPRLLPSTRSGFGNLAEKPFLPNLVRVCVMDLPDGVTFVLEERRKTWNVDPNVLHDTALSNLDRGSAAIPIAALTKSDETPEVVYVDGHDSYDAARILLPSIRQRVLDILGAEVVVAIPTRDVFMAWPKKSPRQQEFIDTAVTTYTSAPYGLYGGLLVFDKGEVRLPQPSDLGQIPPNWTPARR
jgi:hypothetical protein